MRNSVRLSRLRLPMLAVALAATFPAFAQQAATPIERQMTAEEFMAAGLQKLEPQELARLNDWLGRTVEEESRRAAQRTEERVVEERRGFLSAKSGERVEARLDGRFDGFGKGRSFRLDNGQVWRQTDNASLPGVALDAPQVTIAPSMLGAWYLQVEGYNTRAKVERVE